MGDKYIAILLYTKGRMIEGVNGIEYDQPPCRGLTIESGIQFDGFVEKLSRELSIDLRSSEMEIVHRYPHRSPTQSESGSIRFVPLSICNDANLNFLFAVALPPPNVVDLYIINKGTDRGNGEPQAPLSTPTNEVLCTMVASVPVIKKTTNQSIVQSRKERHVSKKRAVWEAKKKAIMEYDVWDKEYQELPRWMHVLKQSNPGTQVEWRLVDSSFRGRSVLRCLFWAFGAAIEGFKFCRPVIQIDRVNYYGNCKDRLLIASSVDSNGHIFLLAFATVDEENADNWGWFLHHLREKVTQREGICLISEPHADIIAAVNNPDNGWVEPRAHHRFCLRHVTCNFYDVYKSEQLKDLIYHTGSQFQIRKYEKCMEEVKQINNDCLQFFNDIAIDKWTQAHDGGHRYGWMTTNLTECVKGILEGAPKLPITSIVELTFYRCVAYFDARREETQSALDRGERYTRYALDKVKKWKLKSCGHVVTLLDQSNELFEVKKFNSKEGNKHIVKLKERTCTCNKWQSFGIPCSHVIAACSRLRVDYWQYIEDDYQLSTYKSCFPSKFQPFRLEDYQPNPDVPIFFGDGRLIKERGWPNGRRIQNEMDWKKTE